jgi:SAM-dependent methyltransferase
MTDILPNGNSRYWAEFWQQAASPAKNRGPMQAGFWNNMAGRFGQDRSAEREDARLKIVLDLIGKTGLDLKGAEVLDIGAGTGALAIPLAKNGANVTALDFSEEMLKKLEMRAQAENIQTIHTLFRSWDEIDLDAEGFRKKFDLVIASMTPAVRCPDTFNRMLDASKGICYYSGWVNRQWDPAYYELYRLLFNDEFREGSHGFYLPFMYLYMNGLRPTVSLRQDVWKGNETVEEMVDTVAGFFSTTKEIDEAMKARMRDYFQARSTDGRYCSKTLATTGMMVWDMREQVHEDDAIKPATPVPGAGA